MKPIVSMIDLKATAKKISLPNSAGLLKQRSASSGRPADLVAVKLHFGELGNTAFIRPVF